MFTATATAIHSLGHGLCTITAVPGSTQPSTLHGTVKWVSDYYDWVIITMVTVDVDGNSQFSTDSQAKSTGLAWELVATQRSVYIHKRSEWTLAMTDYDDSTIKIVVIIITLYHPHPPSHCDSLLLCTIQIPLLTYLHMLFRSNEQIDDKTKGEMNNQVHEHKNRCGSDHKTRNKWKIETLPSTGDWPTNDLANPNHYTPATNQD